MMIYALMNLPIALLLMKSFFDDVPKDVDEAAMIDGATRWQSFSKVVLPMVRGGVAAVCRQHGPGDWSRASVFLYQYAAQQGRPVSSGVPPKAMRQLAEWQPVRWWAGPFRHPPGRRHRPRPSFLAR